MKTMRIAALTFLVAAPFLGTACVYEEDWGRPHHGYAYADMHYRYDHYRGRDWNRRYMHDGDRDHDRGGRDDHHDHD